MNIITELKRKLVHSLSISIFIIYYLYGKETTQNFLFASLIFWIVIEYLRLEKNLKFKFIEDITRENERDNLGAELYFTISALISFLMFEGHIALASVAMATFGDMAAAIGGKILRGNNSGKTLEGTILGYIVNLIICITLLKNIIISFITAAVASITELNSRKINDNLTVPLLSGTMAQILFTAMRKGYI